MPDFWYTLGFSYEVTIYRSLEEAKAAKTADDDDDYLHVFEGEYGKEFSGWVGSNKDTEVG